MWRCCLRPPPPPLAALAILISLARSQCGDRACVEDPGCTHGRIGGGSPTQGAVTSRTPSATSGARVDFDLAQEAAEIAVGGLQEYDHHESAHRGANNSF